MSRGQSHVVGVALMLGLTVVALGGLTLTVGTLVEAQTESADATRVADGFDSAIEPVETTGPHVGRVRFADGRLETVDRDLRVLRNGTVVAELSVGALVFTADERRVAAVAGAVVRGRGAGAYRLTDPPITASDRTDVVVVAGSRLGAGDVAVGGEGGVTVALRTNVSHSRRDLGPGRFGVAIETRTPAPFERYFAEHNATVRRSDFDDDGVDSVLATYRGQRRGYLVTHNLSLEVADG
jgi:hypothetical protein